MRRPTRRAARAGRALPIKSCWDPSVCWNQSCWNQSMRHSHPLQKSAHNSSDWANATNIASFWWIRALSCEVGFSGPCWCCRWWAGPCHITWRAMIATIGMRFVVTFIAWLPFWWIHVLSCEVGFSGPCWCCRWRAGPCHIARRAMIATIGMRWTWESTLNKMGRYDGSHDCILPVDQRRLIDGIGDGLATNTLRRFLPTLILTMPDPIRVKVRETRENWPDCDLRQRRPNRESIEDYGFVILEIRLRHK